MVGGEPYCAAGYELLQLLKVETHLHTVHSDGRDTVRAMLEACRDAGYDAVAVTDHNTVSGLPEARDIAQELGVILIPGVEITTFLGHAVVLGVEYVPEWRDLEQRGMDALADEVHAAGGLLSVAHPAAVGSPICSGCAWEWPIDPRKIDLWEVFNAGRALPEIPYQLWRSLITHGSHAAPIAAGDVHSAAAARALRPATYVYARERTTSCILDSLQQGRLFSSHGERLDVWLDHPDGSTSFVGAPSRPLFPPPAFDTQRPSITPHRPSTAGAENARSDSSSTSHGRSSAGAENARSDNSPTGQRPARCRRGELSSTSDRASADDADATSDRAPSTHADPVASRETSPRTSVEAAVVRELTAADGNRCLYSELRSPDGTLVAISAPIWIDTPT